MNPAVSQGLARLDEGKNGGFRRYSCPAFSCGPFPEPLWECRAPHKVPTHPMNEQQPFRPKARLPRGFKDRDEAELAAETRMLDTIRRVYASYGFQALETRRWNSPMR